MAVDLVAARLITPLIADTTEWNKGFQSATKTATSWTEKIKSAVIDQGVKLIVDGAKAAAKGILNIGKAMVKMTAQAAPLPAIGASFRAMAGQVDLSLDALRNAASGTISDFELMRQANVALTGAGAELGKEFGKKLPALLEAARAASRATGKDVGFLFESLVGGVKRGSPMLIDNTGIVLKLGEANQALANDLGKTVEQLTAQEKSIAILNATVEAGGKLVAQLGSDELTAAEKLQKFNATIQNARDQLGAGLSPVLGNIVGRLSDLLNRVLPPLISWVETRLAPALDLLVDAFGNAADAAVDAGEKFFNGFGRNLIKSAEAALRWGIKISSELAVGLIQGASTAITAAMQFISNMLSSWLSPGSPPKVAPQLDRWGGAWMTELLRGMTEADFGILEKIQGPLSKVLSGPAFQNISGEIIEALSTGKAGPALFDKIAASAGQFGDEIAELARRQVALASATNEVKAAEEGLAKAREQQSKAAETVDALADEFNKLLAAGADPALLDAKRAEFEAAKDSLAVADQEVTAAEERKDAAEEALSPLEKQVMLQDKLLDQLFKLATVGEETTEKITAGIKGIGVALESLPVPTIPPPDFSGVTDAFANAKIDLAASFKDLFKPASDAWDEIQSTLSGAGEQLKKDFEPIDKWMRQQFPIGWLAAKGIVKNVLEGDFPAAFEIAKEAFRIFGEDLQEKWIGFKEKVFDKMGVDAEKLKEDWGRIWEDIKELSAGIWKEFVAIFEGGWQNFLNTFWNPMVEFLELQDVKFFEIAKDMMQGLIDGILSMAGNVLENLTGVVSSGIAAAKALLGIGSPSRAFMEIGANMMQGMAMGIEAHANDPQMSAIAVSRNVSTEVNNFFNQTIHTQAGVGAVTQGFDIQRGLVAMS